MKLFPTLVVLVAVALPAAAGTNTFTPAGPSGGMTFDIDFAADGVLLATTTRGVYRSTDDGAHWTLSHGLPRSYPRGLAVNPADRTKVLLGSTFIKRSSDGGVTWTNVLTAPELATNLIEYVAFSADGTLAWASQANGGDLFRSLDGGMTWTKNTTTGISAAIIAISPDAVNPQLVYVTTPNGGYRSTDGGQTFTKFTFAAYSALITASPVAANRIIATDASDLAWRSVDGGVTWTASLPLPLLFVQYSPGAADKALAMSTNYRILRTVDSGAHWTDIAPAPNGRIWGMAYDPANADHVAIASNGGIFVSTDGGVTWTERNTGLREPRVKQIAIGGTGDGALYVLTGDLASIHRRDSSGNWEPRAAAATPLLGYSEGTNAAGDYYAMAVAPRDANVIYMARDNFFGASADAGATWTVRVSPGLVQSMAASPHDPLVVYAGSALGIPVRSTDGGASWTNLTAAGLPSKVRHFAFDPTDPLVIYAATDNYLPPAASPVYKSVNGGVSFQPTAWDVSSNASVIWTLLHDPARANILYLSSYIGVFKSTDGGSTWTRSALFSTPGQITAGAAALTIDRGSPDILYASSYSNDVIARSVDGGVTWDPFTIDTELFGYTELGLVPGTHSKLLAGRWNGAVEIEFAPNLAVTTSTPSQTTGSGTTATFTVTNGSTFAATDVRLSATVPASATTPSASAGSGSCTLTGPDLLCKLGTLRGNASTTVSVAYSPTTAGSWTATVSSYEPEEASANNSAKIDLAAPPPAPSGGSNGGASAGGGGGGGGRLDYLLLALLFLFTLARTPPLRGRFPSWAAALKKR